MSRTLLLAVIVIALPFVVQMFSAYGLYVVDIMLLYIIAVSGLDLLFGYSGQISMGHAAFFMIGAYGSGLLNNYFNIPLWLTIPMGTALATGIGALLAIPASKLKFHFLSLATIAFGEITYYFLYVSPGGFTGDYLGISVKTISFLGDSYVRWYFFLLVLVIIALVLKQAIVHSRTGRAFRAIRGNTHAADGMGVDVRRYKILAFAISTAYVGFAGAIYVHMLRYVSPVTAQQKQSVLFLTMLLFGGCGSVPGTIIGVVVLEILMEVIRPLQEYQMLFYGVLLLIVIIALPGGIYGGLKDLKTSIERKKSAKVEAADNAGKDGE